MAYNPPNLAGATASIADPSNRDGERPLSPWAARFGRIDTMSNDPITSIGAYDHSGFAPEYPKLHPLFYCNNPDGEQFSQQVGSGYDEDRLFITEARQQNNMGILSWEAGIMNSVVSYSEEFDRVPGGHHASAAGPIDENERADPLSLASAAQRLNSRQYGDRKQVLDALYESNRIQVDETKWFSFLKKDRWMNPHQLDGTLLPWNVDNPLIWAELRVVLELVNRILRALIRDEHDW